jgi:hypothetical protein
MALLAKIGLREVLPDKIKINEKEAKRPGKQSQLC